MPIPDTLRCQDVGRCCNEPEDEDSNGAAVEWEYGESDPRGAAKRRWEEDDDDDSEDSDDDDLYSVDKLLDVRTSSESGITEYLVRWAKPYADPSEDSWEPEWNIVDNSLIIEFNERRRIESTPPLPALAVVSQRFQSLPELVSAVQSYGDDFGVLLVLGATSSGKTTLLKELVRARRSVDSFLTPAEWTPDRSIVSEIAKRYGGIEAACNRLAASGLNAVPQWLQSFNSLSCGQQQRASLAMQLTSNIAVDDFGAYVDTHCRNLIAASISKLSQKQNLRKVVVSSTDTSMVRWLQPQICVRVLPGGGYQAADQPARHAAAAKGGADLPYRPIRFRHCRKHSGRRGRFAPHKPRQGGQALGRLRLAVEPPDDKTVSVTVLLDEPALEAARCMGLDAAPAEEDDDDDKKKKTKPPRAAHYYI